MGHHPQHARKTYHRRTWAEAYFRPHDLDAICPLISLKEVSPSNTLRSRCGSSVSNFDIVLVFRRQPFLPRV